MLNFQHPFLLALLVPLAALVWWHRKRSLSAGERRRFPLLAAALACLTAALANPYWSYTAEKEVVRGVDYVILLDVSQSMFCAEGSQTRMDRAVQMLTTLLPKLTGSSAGVIYFAGDARIGCPLTTDLSALPLFLESVTPGMTTTMGTQSDTLPRTLEDLLSAREAQRKTVGLLVSDGEFADEGRPLLNWLRDRRDFTLYAVQCGKSRAAVPEIKLDASHPGAFSAPDSAALSRLAAAGGGAVFDLATTPVGRVQSALLSSVKESISAGRRVPDYRPVPFVAAAALLIVLYRILPFFAGIRMRPEQAALLSLLLLLAVSPGWNRNQDPGERFQSALKDIKSGRYGEAQSALRQLQASGASEEVEIALGNIAFAQKKYDESIQYYRQALSRNPGNDRARWNWEVALKRKSQQGPTPPPPPPQPPPPAPQLPRDVSALLKYFDQQEKDQIRRNNEQSENKSDFAW